MTKHFRPRRDRERWIVIERLGQHAIARLTGPRDACAEHILQAYGVGVRLQLWKHSTDAQRSAAGRMRPQRVAAALAAEFVVERAARAGGAS
jgi:hypothetical protein